MQGRVAIGLAGALCALAFPPAGQAAVTIGESTSTPGTSSYPCNSSPSITCTFADVADPSQTVAAPFDGVIVRWRIRGAGVSAQMRLRVLRILSSPTNNYAIGEGTGSFETVAPGVESSFPARLPITQGDVIGVDVPGGPGSPAVERSAIVGAGYNHYVPYTPDGGSGQPPFFTFTGAALLFNADIEPDADGDGFGDETQDDCPTSAATQIECVPPDTSITHGPKDKTKKKSATFEFSSTEPGSTFQCSLDGGPFAACSSPDTLKVKKGKHHFEVRATDAAGNVDGSPASDDWKVKKKKH
jgi:hypothetical protein